MLPYSQRRGEKKLSETLYAPPKADVAINDPDGPEFYVVAPFKFFLLSILTLNLYFVYWFYRNWRQIKQRTGEEIWPPARGFFPHFLYPLIVY